MIKFEMFCLLWLASAFIVKCENAMEENRVELRLERIVCACEPTICTLTCNVKFVSRTVAYFNTLATLRQPLNFIAFHMKIFFKHSNNEYRPMLVDAQEEFCDVRNDNKKSLFINVILKGLGSTTNIDQPCPWNPGNYFIKDFNFGIKHLPSIVPEGRYLLNLTMKGSSSTRFIAYWAIYFRITNYGILDLRVG